MRKRPGTWHLGSCLPVTIEGIDYPSFLISFEFSVGQTYVLEFGDYTMRFWIDDHLIIDPNTSQPYQIATPYSYQQAIEMSHAQYKDTMFCTHWDLPIQKLVRGRSATHTNWYWEYVIVEPGDLVKAPTGVRLNQNGHNGVSYAVTAVKSGQESRGGYGAVAAYDPGRSNPTTRPALSSDKDQLYVNVNSWINQWRGQFGNVAGFPLMPSWITTAYEESQKPSLPTIDFSAGSKSLDPLIPAAFSAAGGVTNLLTGMSTIPDRFGSPGTTWNYDHWGKCLRIHTGLIFHVTGFATWAKYGGNLSFELTFNMYLPMRLPPKFLYPNDTGGFTGGLQPFLLAIGAVRTRAVADGNVTPVIDPVLGGACQYTSGFANIGAGGAGYSAWNLLAGGINSPDWRSWRAYRIVPSGAVAGSDFTASGTVGFLTGPALGGDGSINFPITSSSQVTGDPIGITSRAIVKWMTVHGITGKAASGSFTYQDIKNIYDQCIKFLDDGTVRKNNIVAWNAAPGATAYNIYRNTHADEVYTGFYLLAQVNANTRTYEDPDVNTTTTTLTHSPHESGQFFNDPDTYPHVCSFFQQRFLVGSTKSSPLMIGGSTPGFFEDFLLSDNPLDTTGAFRYELTSQTSNPIKHIIPLRGIYILTEAGAFVSPSGQRLNPSNVSFNQEAFNGASSVPVALVDQSAIYIPLNKQMISSLTYDSIRDGFVDDNILFACQHLVNETTIRSVAYARPISSLIAAVLEDGRVLFCTFIPRQEFMGWTEMRTQGNVRQVCTATNALGFDEFYFTVQRDNKYYIEKMGDTRPFINEPNGGALYLDAALRGVFENPVTTVNGLEHLEGHEVGVVADGSVHATKTVTNGAIELDYPASDVRVGLTYAAELETLDLEIQAMPTLRGSLRRIVKATVEIEQTQDIEWCLNDGRRWAVPLQGTTELAQAPQKKTFDVGIGGAADYTNGTRVRFFSDNPLACNINSLVAELQIG